MNEYELTIALGERYKAPEYALLPQVRNGTGYQRRTRTADAIAMSLYPSRGLEMHGFEIKASRADWKRELVDPEKAEEICRFCDRWWVVAGDKNVVADGELPPTWGLLIPRGKQLVCKVEAPKLEPQPLTRIFFAALLRKAALVVTPQAMIDTAIEKALQDKRGDEAKIIELRVEAATRDYQRLRESVEAFEEKSGIKISNWNGGKIGQIVAMLERRGMPDIERDLTQLRDFTTRMTERIDEQLKEYAEQNVRAVNATARP